jgi:hypothetical protein
MLKAITPEKVDEKKKEKNDPEKAINCNTVERTNDSKRKKRII